MTKNKEQLVYLITAIATAILGLVCMVIASVSAFGTSKTEYSHNVEIKEIETQLESVNGVTYHFVSIHGDIINNTSNEYDVVSVEVVFDGVDNKSGQPAEFTSNIIIEKLHSNSKVSVRDKVLKVGNQRGFVPQSIKSIKLILADGMVDIPFEENSESSLILFSGALTLFFVSGLLFAKWNNKRKTAEIKV